MELRCDENSQVDLCSFTFGPRFDRNLSLHFHHGPLNLSLANPLRTPCRDHPPYSQQAAEAFGRN